MSPSMSSSTSTNAPNSVRLRTLPLMRVPTGYFSASSCHGLFSTCLRPSEMRRAAGFQLHEGAVVGQAHDLAAHARADGIAVFDRRPRILHELLVSERDALGRG